MTTTAPRSISPDYAATLYGIAAGAMGPMPPDAHGRAQWAAHVAALVMDIDRQVEAVRRELEREVKSIHITGVLSVPALQRQKNGARIHYDVDAGGAHPDSLWTAYTDDPDERAATYERLAAMNGTTVTLRKVTRIGKDGTPRSEAQDDLIAPVAGAGITVQEHPRLAAPVAAMIEAPATAEVIGDAELAEILAYDGTESADVVTLRARVAASLRGHDDLRLALRKDVGLLTVDEATKTLTWLETKGVAVA